MTTSQSRARHFPSLQKMTYLNTAAEGIPPLCVHQALDEYWKDKSTGMKGRGNKITKLWKSREDVRALKNKLYQSVYSVRECIWNI